MPATECLEISEIHGVFAVTKLDRLFDIRDTEADVLAAFN